MLNIAKVSPTVRDASPFDPIKDVNDLRKAVKGLGTDEEALIKIICKRSNDQRQILRAKYKEEFDRDLIEDIKSDTSFNFRRVLVSLLQKPIDFYAIELREALTKKNSDAFVELLVTLKPSDVRKIRYNYEKMYSSKLSEDISKAFPNSFLFFGVGLLNEERYDSTETDVEAAQKSVDIIINNLQSKIGTEEATIVTVLTESNLQQINLISEEYKKKVGHPLNEDISNSKQLSGIIKETFLAMLEIAEGVADFFAMRLKKSMKGIGTDDGQLIRIIISRSEIDLSTIECQFLLKNNKSLTDWIVEDTSGDYRKALLAVL